MGKDTIVGKILPYMGIQRDKLMNLVENMGLTEEKDDDEFFLSEQEHNQIFEYLSDGIYKYTKFYKLLPFLMIFFTNSLMKVVDKRLKSYNELLSETSKTGLVQCFKRAGVDKN